MKHLLLRISAVGVIAVALLASSFSGSSAAQAQTSTDDASRFFVDSSLTFSGLSSTNSFSLTPSPGESISSMQARLVATADTEEVLVDAFVDGHLTDSRRIDARDHTDISLSLGRIEESADVTVRMSHTDDDCHKDDTRIVELLDITFNVDGEQQRPAGPQDFFPPHLSRVAVAMATPADAASQHAALNTMARLAARYRHEGFVIELVDLAELEFLNPDERAVIIDDDQVLRDEPQLADFGPKVLRIHPDAGVAHLAAMLELAPAPTPDSHVYVQVGDLTKDLSAQGITTAEVSIDVSQTMFSRIPSSYDVHLAGWTSMPHTIALSGQILTVSAGDTIVYTETVTRSGPFEASFTLREPPRDVELTVTLRGPILYQGCTVEATAIEVSVSPLSTIAPVGQRTDSGFGSLPQGFEGVWSVQADGEAWAQAARLMTLVQRPSATPLTLDVDGPVLSVEVTEDEASLVYQNDGLHLEGTLASIDTLLDEIEAQSWYGLDGDIARLGGTGLVTQFVEPQPLLQERPDPRAQFDVIEADDEDVETDEGGPAAAAPGDVPEDDSDDDDAAFTNPPDTLAFAEDDEASLPIATTGKDLPTTGLAIAALFTAAGGIVVHRRDQLLGREAAGFYA